MDRPSTIVLNGFWPKILQGILLAAILAGSSGLLIALRQSWAQEAQERDIEDHEIRLRSLEQHLGAIDSGIQLLLERTSPGKANER